MDGQLRLTAEGTGAEPVVLTIDVSHEQLERFRALTDVERMELEVRAPGALSELVDRIAYLDALPTYELRHRATDFERDWNRARQLLAERHDRERCPECRVHEKNGHAFGCSIAEAHAARRIAEHEARDDT
jgi:hypothetical protein